MLPLAIEPLSETWFVVRGRRSHPDSPLKVAMIFCCCLFKPASATIPKYAVTPVHRIALRNKTNVSGSAEYEKKKRRTYLGE